MDAIERRAEQLLAALPEYIWTGDAPPIPIEEIADKDFGLHVRDVARQRCAMPRACPSFPVPRRSPAC